VTYASTIDGFFGSAGPERRGAAPHAVMRQLLQPTGAHPASFTASRDAQLTETVLFWGPIFKTSREDLEILRK